MTTFWGRSVSTGCSCVHLPAGRWPFARHHSTVIGLTADVPALAVA